VKRKPLLLVNTFQFVIRLQKRIKVNIRKSKNNLTMKQNTCNFMPSPVLSSREGNQVITQYFCTGWVDVLHRLFVLHVLSTGEKELDQSSRAQRKGAGGEGMGLAAAHLSLMHPSMSPAREAGRWLGSTMEEEADGPDTAASCRGRWRPRRGPPLQLDLFPPSLELLLGSSLQA
jgi:hypothetical protein